MLLLVMGNNYVVLFIGWEGVGLCSYLLIGYYYDKVSAAKAASKAFVVNRIGDAGFLLAIFLIFINFRTLDYTQVLRGRPSCSRDGHGDCHLPPHRGGRQISPAPSLHLASGCDGRSDTRQRPHPCGDDGHGRGLHDRAEPCHFRLSPTAMSCWCGHRWHHSTVRRHHRPRANGHQAGAWRIRR